MSDSDKYDLSLFAYNLSGAFYEWWYIINSGVIITVRINDRDTGAHAAGVKRGGGQPVDITQYNTTKWPQ